MDIIGVLLWQGINMRIGLLDSELVEHGTGFQHRYLGI